MSKNKSKQGNSKQNLPQVTLSDADLERLGNAIAHAIAKENNKKEESIGFAEPKNQKMSIKQILGVFFCPLRKLKPKNSALSLVKVITFAVCYIFSKLGYFCAIAVALSGILCLINEPNISAAVTALFQISFAAAMWLLSRLIAAAGMEIEQTQNENIVFGLSAFIISVVAVIMSFAQKGG